MTQEIGELDDEALGWRECCDPGLEPLTELALGRATVIAGLARRRVSKVDRRDWQPARRAPKRLERLAIRDAENPGRSLRLAPKLARLLPDDEHRVVDHLFGQLSAPADAHQEPAQPLVIGGVERLKRCAVTCRDARNQPPILVDRTARGSM